MNFSSFFQKILGLTSFLFLKYKIVEKKTKLLYNKYNKVILKKEMIIIKNIIYKIIILFLCIITIFFAISSNVYSADEQVTEDQSLTVDGIIDDANSFLNKGNNSSPLDTDSMKSLSNIIYNTLLAIGMVLAVIVGIILGIQYMTSSIETKAKNKEHLVAYTVGCMILFGAFGVWKIAVTTFQNSEKQVSSSLQSSSPEDDSSPSSNSTSSSSNSGKSPSNSGSSSSPSSSSPSNSGTTSSSGSSSSKVIQVEKVTLDKEVLMLSVNQYKTSTLECTVSPSNAKNKKITWKSSNPKVVTVSNKGKDKATLVAKSAGKAIITAKTSNGKNAQCEITVIERMKQVSANTPGAVRYLGSDKGYKSTYWKVKKVKWDKKLLESYINNAEELCMSKNFDKYPEAKAVNNLPYYTGAPTGNLTSRIWKLGNLKKTYFR